MNKEDKSKEYAELKVKQYDKYNIIDKYGIHRAMSQCNFDGNDLRDGFEAGWDEASRWTSVEEGLPDKFVEVFAIIRHLGEIQIHAHMYMGEKEWEFGYDKVLAWMPIPSFDEILEANKDVLKRLKDK